MLHLVCHHPATFAAGGAGFRLFPWPAAAAGVGKALTPTPSPVATGEGVGVRAGFAHALYLWHEGCFT